MFRRPFIFLSVLLLATVFTRAALESDNRGCLRYLEDCEPEDPEISASPDPEISASPDPEISASPDPEISASPDDGQNAANDNRKASRAKKKPTCCPGLICYGFSHGVKKGGKEKKGVCAPR